MIVFGVAFFVSVRSKMFFRFVVTGLVVLPCAMSAVMGQTNFGRTGVSQALEPMAVLILCDGKDHYTRLEATLSSNWFCL